MVDHDADAAGVTYAVAQDVEGRREEVSVRATANDDDHRHSRDFQ